MQDNIYTVENLISIRNYYGMNITGEQVEFLDEEVGKLSLAEQEKYLDLAKLITKLTNEKNRNE